MGLGVGAVKTCNRHRDQISSKTVMLMVARNTYIFNNKSKEPEKGKQKRGTVKLSLEKNCKSKQV